MERDDGYTLVECLVALIVIGLAIGGLSAAMMSLGRLQASAVREAPDGQVLRQARTELAALLEAQGPFLDPGPQVFQGSAGGFQFACGPETLCRAWLTPGAGGVFLHIARDRRERSFLLKGVRAARFVYDGTRTIGPAWPTGTTEPQALGSIGLVAEASDGTPLPVDSVRIWMRQPLTCDFDMIIGDCRR